MNGKKESSSPVSRVVCVDIFTGRPQKFLGSLSLLSSSPPPHPPQKFVFSVENFDYAHKWCPNECLPVFPEFFFLLIAEVFLTQHSTFLHPVEVLVLPAGLGHPNKLEDGAVAGGREWQQLRQTVQFASNDSLHPMTVCIQ